MLEKRTFNSLGHFELDWLNARHHFSFGEYSDRDRMNWGALRVWNDDEIRPGGGFQPHPHRDMEIITYVRSGAITHRDNLGNEGRTEAGDVQVMSAGTGVIHSEFNRESETTSLFQIWILPSERGVEPRWDTAKFPKADRAGDWVVLASGNPERDGGLLIQQDASVLGATVKAGETLQYEPAPGRSLYLVNAGGRAIVNGVELDTRDGIAILDEAALTITAEEDTELVMVDAP
jgi:redox-sensitive bicupin YhaK (pirin superfamily)